MDRYYPAPPTPSAFFWRRLQSLMGLFLVIYLISHLLTNSQAALFIGDDGRGFIKSVNGIHDLPYLPVIELLVIAIPFLIHGIWGAWYLRSAKMNSWKTDGSTPALLYPRNKAYSWQRITSYLLVVGIIGHVVHMRWIKYPSESHIEGQQYWMLKLDRDSGLDTLAARLGVTLLDKEKKQAPLMEIDQVVSVADQKSDDRNKFFHSLEKYSLNEGQVIAVAKDFGTAELLLVRETFKMPVMIILYTILVLAACYHGFNGVWTFMITWGITLTAASQRMMRYLSTALMLIVAFLGLAAAWGTYWINLKF